MKQILLLTFFLLSFSASALAQASVTSESFDIATFQPPKGWEKRQPSDMTLRFSTEDKASGTYCRITLFKSLLGPGNSRENFDAAWKTIIKEGGDIAAPQMFPSNNREDWALEGGFAPFEMSGQKAVALLFTISGYGKMVNVLILTNARAYDADVTAFVESIKLEKPAKN